MHGAFQRLGAGVLDHALRHQLVARDQPVVGRDDLDEVGALEPLHHHPYRPVAQFQHPHHGAEGAYLIELFGSRLHDRTLGGLGAAERPHHAEQQALVALHHLIDEVHGVRVHEREGQDDVRVDDQLAEGQNRQSVFHHCTFTDCGPESRAGSLASRTARKPPS